MNAFAFIFFLLNAIALLALPRRWAPLPLLVGTCYMTLGQTIEIGPFHFTIIRLLVLVGILRTYMRGERLNGKLNALDRVMLAWAVWALISGLVTQGIVGQLGLVYNTLGIYFMIRVLCGDINDTVHLIKIIAYVLAPVALEMLNEQITNHNFFAIFGGVPEMVVMRGERLRAQGPFGHAILAGTVGAACFPLMIGIWRYYPISAKIGLGACLLMVVASASSGPLMSLIFGIFTLMIWRWRHLTKWIQFAGVLGYVLLDIVMEAPAYYLLARIDLTGSSTGWHRAELLKQAIDHLGEWWFSGTTYTRHWMPYGVTWSPDHCDITNQYIGYGVVGGVPLMILFMAALWLAFGYVGKFVRVYETDRPRECKFVWSLGSALFAQAASGISVYYFDQSFIFLFLNLAVIGSLFIFIKNSDVILQTPQDSGVSSLRDADFTELSPGWHPLQPV